MAWAAAKPPSLPSGFTWQVLYLEEPSHDDVAILASKQLKAGGDGNLCAMWIVKQIAEAWQKSIENNCAQDCEKLKPRLELIAAAMVDMNKGDKMTLTFYPDRVELVLKGEKKAALPGADFSRALLATWLGPKPPQQRTEDRTAGREIKLSSERPCSARSPDSPNPRLDIPPRSSKAVI